MRSLLFVLVIITADRIFAQPPTTVESAGQLAGNWVLVTVKSMSADSTLSYPYGENPAGRMTLANDGNYSIQIYNSNRNKITSGNKNNATSEENSMLVKGSNAHYGSYTIDLKNSVIIFNPEHAFFPNWEGQQLKQNYELQGNILTYSSGLSTFGASKSIVVWRKK